MLNDISYTKKHSINDGITKLKLEDSNKINMTSILINGKKVNPVQSTTQITSNASLN